MKDTSPDAFARVVDNLLASERFGEYWGRHWLDVARYGESAGRDATCSTPSPGGTAIGSLMPSTETCPTTSL